MSDPDSTSRERFARGMTKRRKRSLVRGSRIFLDGAPPRWKPPIDSIPVDYLRRERGQEAADDWLPDENDDERHSDEVGDEAAAVAFLGAVLDELLGDRDEVIDDDADAADSNEEPQP